MPEAGQGPVGDGFDREGPVVAAVEGELPGGPVVGSKGIAAQRDATDPGALQAEV